MARLGKSIAKQSEGRAGKKYLPVGGWVRKSRAMEDQSAPIPEEITSELGGIICNLVRRPQSGLIRVSFQGRANERAWRDQRILSASGYLTGYEENDTVPTV